MHDTGSRGVGLLNSLWQQERAAHDFDEKANSRRRRKRGWMSKPHPPTDRGKREPGSLFTVSTPIASPRSLFGPAAHHSLIILALNHAANPVHLPRYRRHSNAILPADHGRAPPSSPRLLLLQLIVANGLSLAAVAPSHIVKSSTAATRNDMELQAHIVIAGTTQTFVTISDDPTTMHFSARE